MSERRARRIIRGWDGLRAFTGYGRTQLQQMIKDGEFVPPMKLGPRAVGWFEDDVREWQDRLAATAEGKAG
jgi:predicted DNA-binding transcriptional regulator AlpA